jgi:hypothetical protein
MMRAFIFHSSPTWDNFGRVTDFNTGLRLVYIRTGRRVESSGSARPALHIGQTRLCFNPNNPFGRKPIAGASLLAKVLDFASPASWLLHTAF